MNNFINRLGRSRALSPRTFQYACAISGPLTLVSLFASLAASGFLPPIPPSWDAEQTVKHYRNHEKGIQAGAALFVISGLFYLPWTACVSAQMRRIPNLDYATSVLQLAGGATAALTLVLPGLTLAAASYNLSRPVEITQVLNELYWMTLSLPWPSFAVQDFACAYATIMDTRPKPLFPKPIALLNFLPSMLYVLSSAVHSFHTGPMAWNGAAAFWVPAVAFGLQMVVDFVCIIRAIYTDRDTLKTTDEVSPGSLENGSNRFLNHDQCQAKDGVA